jgi:hypothetical protein
MQDNKKQQGDFGGKDRRRTPVIGNRTPLSDNQRRILTTFERHAKEQGEMTEAGQHGVLNPAEVSKVKAAFDKARAEIWGMVTTMRRGVVDASNEVERVRKDSKPMLVSVYHHPHTEAGAMLSIDYNGEVTEMEFTDGDKAVQHSKTIAKQFGLVAATGNNEKDYLCQFSGIVVCMTEVKLNSAEVHSGK